MRFDYIPGRPPFGVIGLAIEKGTINPNINEAKERLIGERDENTQRKAFTPEEAVLIGERVEALEQPEAEKRQRASTSKAGKAGGRGRPKNSVRVSCPHAKKEDGRTTAKAAAAVFSIDGIKTVHDLTPDSFPAVARRAGQYSVAAAVQPAAGSSLAAHLVPSRDLPNVERGCAQ